MRPASPSIDPHPDAPSVVRTPTRVSHRAFSPSSRRPQRLQTNTRTAPLPAVVVGTRSVLPPRQPAACACLPPPPTHTLTRPPLRKRPGRPSPRQPPASRLAPSVSVGPPTQPPAARRACRQGASRGALAQHRSKRTGRPASQPQKPQAPHSARPQAFFGERAWESPMASSRPKKRAARMRGTSHARSAPTRALTSKMHMPPFGRTL